MPARGGRELLDGIQMDTTPSPTRLRGLLSLLLAPVLAVGLFTAVPRGAEAQTPGLPPVTDFAATGPFAVTVQTDAEHTYYSPATLGQGGIDHPIILWGNGTSASPSTYDGLLRHLASH